jgi:hypothetical protein
MEPRKPATKLGTKKAYGNPFGVAKDESENCPYGNCGRKFGSQALLKQHLERRHNQDQMEQKLQQKEPERAIIKEEESKTTPVTKDTKDT